MEGFDNKDYVVDKILRKKPLGSVYKARRVSDGVLCAIKELDVRHMSEEEREDALEEIRVLTTVRNENVISYYDAFRGENKLYVVMEYCDEPDLGRHIKTRAEHQKFFSESQVWSYLIQVLRGLVAVHSRGLIHRDVTSGNIIQLDSHAIKIGDIRVGKVLNDGVAAPDIGNPQFVPPEVWRNKAYTFKSDVWAVGCVLYEMITLAVPFGGCSLPDLRTKVIEGAYQPIPTSFSTGLSSVLKLLLNPDQAARISARDMLLHPILQAHLHYAPAPAPILRVRRSQDKKKLESIPAKLSTPMELKTSYPTLVVPGDKELMDGQALESNQVVDPPGNGHQSGLSYEKPTASSARSRVAPILAPRAILSSRDNDEMLADVNRPANQLPKAKLPRVAMLSKVIPKSPIETSPAPQGLPSTPRVNVKHFKTAYVQSPKVDPDEFQTGNDRSDVSSVISAPGTLKKKCLATPPKVATPWREKSTESVRSVCSSRSDDSSIRIRAPIDVLDHIELATPRRENSLDSTRSVASSRSGDSAIRVRAPVDISDTALANVVAYKVNSLKSVVSSGSSYSNGSAISVRATITELDPAQPLHISDDPHASLAGDRVVTHEGPALGTNGIVDGPEPSQRLTDSTGTEPHPSDSLVVEALDSLAQPSSASRTKPVPSQTTPNRNITGARDGVASKPSVANGSGVKALGDVSGKRLPNSRNRRLSFDGIRNEGPLISDNSKTVTPRRESSSGIRKLGALHGAATKCPTNSVTPARPQDNGKEPSQGRRPATSTRPQQLSSDGIRKKAQNGDITRGRSLDSHGKEVKLPGGDIARGRSLDSHGKEVKLAGGDIAKGRPLDSHGKDVKVPGGNPVDSSQSGSAVTQARRKSSALPPIVTPTNQGRKQGAHSVSGGRNPGALPAQTPQNPTRSRRLSLDFAIKGKEVQPMGRGLGRFTGLAI